MKDCKGNCNGKLYLGLRVTQRDTIMESLGWQCIYPFHPFCAWFLLFLYIFITCNLGFSDTWSWVSSLASDCKWELSVTSIRGKSSRAVCFDSELEKFVFKRSPPYTCPLRVKYQHETHSIHPSCVFAAVCLCVLQLKFKFIQQWVQQNLLFTYCLEISMKVLNGWL